MFQRKYFFSIHDKYQNIRLNVFVLTDRDKFIKCWKHIK